MMTMNPTEKFNSWTFRIPTPDGTLNVIVMENNVGDPFEIQLVIGKAGSAVAAWAYATARLCSTLLQTNACKINDLITHLSSANSDKISYTDSREPVRSGPDGLALALLKYQNAKFESIRISLGIPDESYLDDE